MLSNRAVLTNVQQQVLSVIPPAFTKWAEQPFGITSHSEKTCETKSASLTVKQTLLSDTFNCPKASCLVYTTHVSLLIL